MNQAWDAIKGVRKPKISICIPYVGSFYPEWIESTYGPLRYVPVDWCDKLPILSKAPSLPVARSSLEPGKKSSTPIRSQT